MTNFKASEIIAFEELGYVFDRTSFVKEVSINNEKFRISIHDKSVYLSNGSDVCLYCDYRCNSKSMLGNPEIEKLEDGMILFHLINELILEFRNDKDKKNNVRKLFYDNNKKQDERILNNTVYKIRKTTVAGKFEFHKFDLYKIDELNTRKFGKDGNVVYKRMEEITRSNFLEIKKKILSSVVAK